MIIFDVIGGISLSKAKSYFPHFLFIKIYDDFVKEARAY